MILLPFYMPTHYYGPVFDIVIVFLCLIAINIIPTKQHYNNRPLKLLLLLITAVQGDTFHTGLVCESFFQANHRQQAICILCVCVLYGFSNYGKMFPTIIVLYISFRCSTTFHGINKFSLLEDLSVSCGKKMKD